MEMNLDFGSYIYKSTGGFSFSLIPSIDITRSEWLYIHLDWLLWYAEIGFHFKRYGI